MTTMIDFSEQAPIKQGLYPNVAEQSYHADQRAISQSDMRMILKSPAHFRWAKDHPAEPKQVFDYGSAAHALVLGVGQPIEVIEVEVEATRDGRRQKIVADNHAFRLVQEAEDRARAAGRIPLLPEEWRHVQEMADALTHHRLAMELLSDGQAEVSAYALDEPTAVWVKGRFDFLGQSLVDFKTTVSADPAGWAKKCIDYGYDLQAATYLDLAAANGRPDLGWVWICQEKTEPYVATVMVPEPELIDRGRRLKRRALEMFRDCSEAGVWPAYCPDDEFVMVAAPPWALREEDY